MIFSSVLTNKKREEQRQQEKRAAIYRNLLRKEAEIGGTLFGPIPGGVRREFFCLDEHTWVWHEEWTDQNGKRQIKTTRYDVRPDGILKAQSGQQYQRLSATEETHLRQAARAYLNRVHKDIYAAII